MLCCGARRFLLINYKLLLTTTQLPFIAIGHGSLLWPISTTTQVPEQYYCQLNNHHIWKLYFWQLYNLAIVLQSVVPVACAIDLYACTQTQYFALQWLSVAWYRYYWLLPKATTDQIIPLVLEMLFVASSKHRSLLSVVTMFNASL